MPSLFLPLAASLTGVALTSNVRESLSTESTTSPSASETFLRNSKRLSASSPSSFFTTSPGRRPLPSRGRALPSSVTTSPTPVTMRPSALSAMPMGAPPTYTNLSSPAATAVPPAPAESTPTSTARESTIPANFLISLFSAGSAPFYMEKTVFRQHGTVKFPR